MLLRGPRGSATTPREARSWSGFVGWSWRLGRHPGREVGGELPVGLCSLAAPAGGQDRPAGRGRLRELDRLGDRGLEDLELVGYGDVVEHRAGVVGAAVVQ